MSEDEEEKPRGSKKKFPWKIPMGKDAVSKAKRSQILRELYQLSPPELSDMEAYKWMAERTDPKLNPGSIAHMKSREHWTRFTTYVNLRAAKDSAKKHLRELGFTLVKLPANRVMNLNKQERWMLVESVATLMESEELGPRQASAKVGLTPYELNRLIAMDVESLTRFRQAYARYFELRVQKMGDKVLETAGELLESNKPIEPKIKLQQKYNPTLLGEDGSFGGYTTIGRTIETMPELQTAADVRQAADLIKSLTATLKELSTATNLSMDATPEETFEQQYRKTAGL